MYNEGLKTAFIQKATTNETTAVYYEKLFNSFEPYEEAWSADLCTRSAEELQPVLEEVLGLRQRTRYTQILRLRAYIRYCIEEDVPGVRDDILSIESAGIEKVRREMVSGPAHLQNYLDTHFRPESLETVDNLIRCYFWLAFGGLEESEVLAVRVGEVDFADMVVRHGGREIPIYREGVAALRSAVSLDSFTMIEPRRTFRKKRVPGETLIRGSSVYANFRTYVSGAYRDREMPNESRRSYYPTWLSGIFFRAYERERFGEEPDFTGVVAESFRAKGLEVPTKASSLGRRDHFRRDVRDFKEDYARWKEAFRVS